MAIGSLLVKDYLEHRWAALVLGAGSIVVVLLLLAQNRAAAYSMSPFEIVRFAMLGFFPLTALILGNRLIVREYLNGTRLFVEALPIGSFMPLLIKFVLGWFFMALICLLMIALAANQAGVVDDVTPEYLALILGKSLVMITLYWSVVFCFSLCGYLRIALYLVLAALVALIAFQPGIDSSRLAPFALIDEDMFVYERDVIPWRDIWVTLVISAAFAGTGFLLTRLGEGSVLERLAKPMTRRDYVALGVLFAAGLAVWSTLVENNSREPIDFSSRHVVRLSDPDISVLYMNEIHRQSAQEVAQRIRTSLEGLQAALSLQALPTVRLVLSPSREKHDIDYMTTDGVLITANWLEHDSYDDAILDTVILHGVLSIVSGGRAMFEPYHWVLDGFSRWWAEQGTGELQQAHQTELLARALLTLDRSELQIDLINGWQQLADRHSYPSAESLAWVAMNYIENEYGREALLSLADQFFAARLGPTAVDSFRDRMVSASERVEGALGVDMQDFDAGWKQWLEQQRQLPDVQFLMRKVPPLSGRVVPKTDDEGVHRIEASYSLMPGATASELDSLEGNCILKHDYIGPFDTEFEVSDDYEIVGRCETGTVAHIIDSTYAPGDRVFVALDFESPFFHQPVRLHVERVTVP